MLIAKAICDQLDDQALIRRALEEVDYFSCLYERYEARLLRYIHRLVSVSGTEAEDILQDAFIKVWKNLQAYDPAMPLSSWLYRIVHNVAISAWRKSVSYGKHRRVDNEEEVLARLPDDTLPPLEEWSVDTDAASLRQSLEELPLKYREVLVLKYFEQLSYEAISDVLKLPEGTVATRLNRARKALAQQISSHQKRGL
jgi:RNA polymerase sigma-70 factor (ECF subfamily)